MGKGVICSSCGRVVKSLCANCWRCSQCKKDCTEHMKRLINGKIVKSRRIITH